MDKVVAALLDQVLKLDRELLRASLVCLVLAVLGLRLVQAEDSRSFPFLAALLPTRPETSYYCPPCWILNPPG